MRTCPMASIGLAADGWLADQINDPASDVSAYVREVRDRVAATERVIAHRRTGELMALDSQRREHRQ